MKTPQHSTTNTYQLPDFIPTLSEVELIMAIRGLKRFEKLDIKLSDNNEEIIWTLTSNYRQVYRLS